MTISLETLIAGRARLLRKEYAAAQSFLDAAVEGLRKAGAQEFIVRGLLARAAFFRETADYAKAWDDLNETVDIASLSGMKLHLCDYHLEAALLCDAEGKTGKALEHKQAAGKLIEETGYKKIEVAQLRHCEVAKKKK